MLRTELRATTADGCNGLVARVERIDRVEVANALPVDGRGFFAILTVTVDGSGLDAMAFEEVDDVHAIDLQPLPAVEGIYQVLVRIDVGMTCLLTTLTAQDAIPHRITGDGATVDVVISTRDWTHLKEVATAIEDRHGPIELVGTTQTDAIGFALGSDKLAHNVLGTLSDDQLKALEAAYRMGYFRVPQEVTSRDVAKELEISRSTLSERLRRAENNLCELLFGEL